MVCRIPSHPQAWVLLAAARGMLEHVGAIIRGCKKLGLPQLLPCASEACSWTHMTITWAAPGFRPFFTCLTVFTLASLLSAFLAALDCWHSCSNQRLECAWVASAPAHVLAEVRTLPYICSSLGNRSLLSSPDACMHPLQCLGTRAILRQALSFSIRKEACYSGRHAKL